MNVEGLSYFYMAVKKMKVRRKTAVILGGIISVLFVLLAGLSHELLMNRFAALEQERAMVELNRVNLSLQAKLDMLAGIAQDNGKWDESYRFISEQTDTYVKEVVTDTSTAHRLDVWLMLDNGGNLLYGKAFDSERRELPLPDVLRAAAWRSGETTLLEGAGSGVVLVGQRALLIGYHPITSSDGAREPAGVLVVGKYLDGALQQDLSAQVQADLAVVVDQVPLAERAAKLTLKEAAQVLQGQVAIADLAGQGQLKVELELPRRILQQGQNAFRGFALALAGLAAVAIFLMLWLLERTVLRRLLQLTQQVQQIRRQEDCRERLSVDGADELTDLATAVNGMLQMLEEAFNRLQASNNTLGNLLNNAGQGMLTFGADRLVDPSYSVECLRFFGDAIAQQDVCRLLYPAQDAHSGEEREFLAHAIERIFSEPDVERRKVFLTLLPEELTLNGLTLEVKYKVLLRLGNGVPSPVMMLIITDVTEKRQLEQQFRLERNVLKMVIASRLNYNDLSECIQDYRQFCRRELPDMLEGGVVSLNRLAELLHHIHTFKGKFAQFHLLRLVDELHGLEQTIIDLRERGASSEAYRASVDAERMILWLDEDIRLLKRFLGERFFASAELLTVSRQELLALEKKVLQNMSRFDCQWLLPMLRKLRYKPFRDLLASYPEYAATMAERLGRQLAPIVIEGGDILVNPQYYRGFCNALVHLVKNALEHGLEEPLERKKGGKPESGAIQCRIKLTETGLIVTFSDDGRGIAVDEIRRRALREGIFEETALNKMTEEEIIQLIFRDDFSTCQSVSRASGRGIGLAAVKKEVDKLGGTIEVKTKRDRGTTFVFSLPLDRHDAPLQISWDAVMQPLAQAARDFWQGHGCLPQEWSEQFDFSRNGLRLEEMTAFIGVKGVLQGMFVLSANRAFLESLSGGLQPDVLAELAEAETWEGLVAESANVILGNSLTLFPTHLKSILIDTPVTLIQTGGGRINYPHREVWSYSIAGAEALLSIHFISLEMSRLDVE